MIPIAKPELGEAEANAARDAILTGWVTQGPEVAAFEAAFAAHVGAAHACAVSNCTTALHLALLAIGVSAGDEVILPSHSFIATANSVAYCGGVPVFVDIDPATFNIDPGAVEAAVTRRSRAILAVHQMGMPCDLVALRSIADRHGLALIEDAACAAGSEIRIGAHWRKIGQPVGDIACFSFHPRKVITTGEGGMLTTLDGRFDETFRLLRQHGMSVSDAVRHASPQVIFEAYGEVGYNYRMTEMQAAIGRKQIERLPAILARRRRIAARYADQLSAVPGLRLPVEPPWARSNWQSYCVGLPPSAGQRQTMQRLLDRGIATRRGIMCSHRERPYAERVRRHALTRSEQAQDRCVLLPIFAQMTDDDQDRVVEALEETLRA